MWVGVSTEVPPNFRTLMVMPMKVALVGGRPERRFGLLLSRGDGPGAVVCACPGQGRGSIGGSGGRAHRKPRSQAGSSGTGAGVVDQHLECGPACLQTGPARRIALLAAGAGRILPESQTGLTLRGNVP